MSSHNCVLLRSKVARGGTELTPSADQAGKLYATAPLVLFDRPKYPHFMEQHPAVHCDVYLITSHLRLKRNELNNDNNNSLLGIHTFSLVFLTVVYTMALCSPEFVQSC